MNKKRLKSYLNMSVFLGGVINFFLILIIGVFSKEIYNYIMTGICSVIPVLIFSVPVIIELNNYGRIRLKKAILFLIIFVIISFGFGTLIEVLINKVFNVDICKIGRMENTLYNTLIGVIIGNIINNIYSSVIKK